MDFKLQGTELATHTHLHSVACRKLPDITPEPDVFWVAVLPHNKDIAHCQPPDFIWFKVKAKHSVIKVRNAWFKRKGIEAELRQGHRCVPDHTQMRHLNHFHDNVIAFWTTSDTSDPAPTLSQVESRTPLQAVNNTQPCLPGPANVGPTIKPEPNTGTPDLLQHPSQHVVSSAAPPRETPTVKSEPSGTNIAWHPPHQPAAPQPQVTKRGMTGYEIYADEIRQQNPHHNQEKLENIIARQWSLLSANSRAEYEKRAYRDWQRHIKDNVTGAPAGSNNDAFAREFSEQVRAMHSNPAGEQKEAVYQPPPEAPKPPQDTRLQKIIENGSPEALEKEVKASGDLLETLQIHLKGDGEETNKDAQHWLQQIETLQNQVVDTPTIIGVVGNTGAGKSSVINAMLDEERLVPTNCMRACTAVVTEMSWNSSDDPDAKYRAAIEFIKASDWEKDLRLSLNELLDGSGNVSRECNNPESEAGIAYAKIKAVYPQKTKEMLAQTSVEELINETGVKEVLGTVKNGQRARPEPFYKALQHYVDSKEKSTGDLKKKKEKRQMEFWPLIKVVKIYTKADALSTGAVIVDLPGVHDSNAARAAVAAGYMKNCTGLWICAPINRAVDDKAAKSLLGESFKRQLKYDGVFSRITFICSKTDDISITEASDSLGLEEQMAADWAKIDENEQKQRALRTSIAELKESREVYCEVLNDTEDAIDVWDSLKDDAESGKTVFAPCENPPKEKKRKHSPSPKQSCKKRKGSDTDSEGNEDDDFIDDEDEDENDIEDSGTDDKGESSASQGKPVTLEDIEQKLDELKSTKKNARQERSKVDVESKEIREQLGALEKAKNVIEAGMSAICIEGRNKYSKSAIQLDFAAGIKELDQENAEEEDADNFNPEEDIRDYDQVARSLPVFAVSSRAYQKLKGRLQRDANVPGFRTPEETEIPQLQAHCKKLTEAGRAANCRRYLNSLSQLLLSLNLWANNDGTGANLSDAQRAAEGRFLQSRLQTLEKDLEKAVQDCLKDMKDALSENIYEHFENVIQLAIDEAPKTSKKWGDPVNKVDRSQGGYYWATYKAICRREGVYSNAQGTHDFNNQLTEPIMKHLAHHWEKAFARKLPQVLQSFTRKSKTLLSIFHQEIELRTRNNGTSVAGLAMLAQQLRTYEATFAHLTNEMVAAINNWQKDSNREFVPVIASNLASAYEWCAVESGSGQYVRMKNHMNNHVETTRHSMFQDSCNEVKSRLTQMCRQVEEAMANKTDEVFMLMRRDYLTVINGAEVPKGGIMPKWERQMRSSIAAVIQSREDGENAEKEAEDGEVGKPADGPEGGVDSEPPEETEAMPDENGENDTQDPSKQLEDEASRVFEDDPLPEVVAKKEPVDTDMSS